MSHYLFGHVNGRSTVLKHCVCEATGSTYAAQVIIDGVVRDVPCSSVYLSCSVDREYVTLTRFSQVWQNLPRHRRPAFCRRDLPASLAAFPSKRGSPRRRTRDLEEKGYCRETNNLSKIMNKEVWWRKRLLNTKQHKKQLRKGYVTPLVRHVVLHVGSG